MKAGRRAGPWASKAEADDAFVLFLAVVAIFGLAALAVAWLVW